MIAPFYVQWKKPEAELFRRIWKSDNEAMGQVFRLGLPIGLTSLPRGIVRRLIVMSGLDR
jgi:MATE family multidrug resistance protein